MKEKDVLLIGLPETGKTTFLAALWYLVDSNIEEKSFKLYSLKGDQEYLNSIREAWLNYEPVPRTVLKESLSEKTELLLIDTNTQEQVTLTIPDFSGETFQNSLEQREWPLELDNLIKQSNGIIIFINPSKLVNPILIVDAQEIEELFTDGPEFINTTEGDETDESSNLLRQWTHEMISTQVKLIDLLQIIDSRKIITMPLKLSVVVSAWDLIEDLTQNSDIIKPGKWLEVRLPMLYQFLSCNTEKFDTKVFGLSAQGADYTNEDLEWLYGKEDPAKRILIKTDSNYSNDITLPIIWVTSQ